MPRLPTMRVTGSQDMLTRLRGLVSVTSRTAMLSPCSVRPARVVAAGQLRAVVAPPGLLVAGVVRDRPQFAYHPAVYGGHRRRECPARRLVHERHELVREAGHGAADADAAHVWAAADPGHPAALGDVAVDDRAPAAQLHLALGRVVVQREIALLVVAGAVAALMHGLAEQPRGPQGLV